MGDWGRESMRVWNGIMEEKDSERDVNYWHIASSSALAFSVIWKALIEFVSYSQQVAFLAGWRKRKATETTDGLYNQSGEYIPYECKSDFHCQTTTLSKVDFAQLLYVNIRCSSYEQADKKPSPNVL